MVEAILVGFMVGLVLMPGGNFQMQYYSRYFMPILIQMIGLPNVVVFWTYQLVFPAEHVPPFVKDPIAVDYKMHQIIMHIVSLEIVAWLLTVGPREDLFATTFSE